MIKPCLWRPIVGFKRVLDNMYEVSNTGEVKRLSDGHILHKKIANKQKHPYYAVSLKTTKGLEWILVHQLVATFFVKIDGKYANTDEELVPDHLDNNGLNNHYTNLEWKTRRENTQDAYRKKHVDRSCDKGRNALITNDQAHDICKLLEDGYLYDEILSRLNLPINHQYRALLARIKNHVAWTDISCKYNIPSEGMYTNTQYDMVSKIPRIRELYASGYKPYQIVDIIWDHPLTSRQRETKAQSVSDIISGKTYRDIQKGSQTRES